MEPKLQAGFLQTHEYPNPNTVLIRDEIHGTHSVSEPVLVELLRSPALARLAGVSQHGVTGLLGVTPHVTRLEHSVGAFLLVRNVGASLEEQIAGLLHDISHTALSHVVDWALSEPGESYHEVHKDRFIETTNLPEILRRHGYVDLKPLHEELYGLVEADAPHLCADRLDYALRDSVALGKLSLDAAHSVLASLKAHPDASHPDRMLVLQDEDTALSLSRAYLATDRDVWSNPAHVDVSLRTGTLIGNMIKEGKFDEDNLWKTDKEFWESLRAAADDHGRETMERLERELLPDEDGMALPKNTKVRTLNPDIWVTETNELIPLSVASEEWDKERQAYVEFRQAMMK